MRNTQIGPADHPLEFIAGSLALDFTNTLGGTHRDPSHEHLCSYADLVKFAVGGGSLSSAEADVLIAEAERRPSRAADVLRQAREMREAIWRVFAAIADGEKPPSGDLGILNRQGARALAHARVTPDFGWSWSDATSLERVLWPIARSALELYVSPADRERVRECASDTCEWLFIDRSKSRTRRWCDMSDCGNRAKQRRLRQRAASAHVSR